MRCLVSIFSVIYLCQTVEIEVSDVHILEQFPEATRHQSPASSSLPPSQPVLRYVHFSSDRVEALFQEVCHLLGRYGSLTVIVDYLLDQLRLSSSLRGKELLLILSHVLIGDGQRKRTDESAGEIFVLVEGLLEEVVAPGNWNRSHDSVGEHSLFWEEEKSSSSKVRAYHDMFKS